MTEEEYKMRMLPTWEEFKEFYLIYIKKHPDDQYIPKTQRDLYSYSFGYLFT